MVFGYKFYSSVRNPKYMNIFKKFRYINSNKSGKDKCRGYWRPN